MSYASNDEIRGVLIQAGNARVLLPNATVAEMMSRVPVQPVSDAPRWLVGNNKVVVLKALSGNAQRPYYALLTQNFPQLISVPRDGLLADASEETLPDIVHMRVLLGEQSALLPNLDALEAALDSLAA